MKRSRIATVIVVLVALVAVGIGGFYYGTTVGEARAASARARFFQERGAGAGAPNGQGGPGGRGLAGNGVVGQVKSIQGNTIELSTATEVVKVQVADQAQIQKMVPGALADIQIGERVIVQGERGADGAFIARLIEIGQDLFRGGPNAPASGNQ
ncbi:MAG: hypothetical protein M5U01_06830 [Ardenticatenaceae bacterium]|nr:hypothetical protein [Ardenticatenaceae bacterium]